MNIETIRRICLSLPQVEEEVKWGHDLCFLIGRKMFCVLNLEPQRGDRSRVAFKATPEEFVELNEREGVIPAPYMARNHWVSLEDYSTLPGRELEARLARSYELVKVTLPKKLQAALGAQPKERAARRRLSKRG